MTTSSSTNTIRIIGVPMDLGQSQRGVDMGPSALRYAGLTHRLEKLGHTVENAANVEVRIRDILPPEGGMAYLPAVVEACEAVYEQGQMAISEGRLPLFLGGDHSIAIGAIGGVSHNERTGVIWIDAHGDFNTPATSPSGNIHGMPLAVLMGHGVPELVHLGRDGPKLRPTDVMLIGVRDLDAEERIALKKSGIGIYTMREIDEYGMAVAAREALKRLSHLNRIHVSFDVDSLDPAEAPGVGTPEPGGLSFREAHLLMEIIADTGCLRSIDVVEINPILDDRNHTAEIALDLIASLLGQSIL